MNNTTENLPPEMKKVTDKLREAVLRERKARQQIEYWTREHSVAEAALEAANKEYGVVSLRWNPTKNTIEPLEEISTQQGEPQ